MDLDQNMSTFQKPSNVTRGVEGLLWEERYAYTHSSTVVGGYRTDRSMKLEKEAGLSKSSTRLRYLWT